MRQPLRCTSCRNVFNPSFQERASGVAYAKTLCSRVLLQESPDNRLLKNFQTIKATRQFVIIVIYYTKFGSFLVCGEIPDLDLG
jgi:hypothetical protein